MNLRILPAPYARWVPRRKAMLVNAIREGGISFDDARELYEISADELRSWTALLDKYGIRGLRATRAQEYARQEVVA